MTLPLSGLTVDTCVVALQLLRVSSEAALREVMAAAQPEQPEPTPEPVVAEDAPEATSDGQ